ENGQLDGVIDPK
nr:RecName: Full=Unknown protein 4 [Pseudotsuga menziesii]